jgi:hypothetical protein
MRASFGIAIGISAIDALLCAFTAVTLLALVVVSPTTSSGGSIAENITIIEVQKVAAGGGALSTMLLLDIQSTAQPGNIVQIESAPHIVVKYSPENAHLFASSAGRIEWSDSTCGETKCVSHLFVTAAQKIWAVRFRFAGDASSENGSDKIDLVIRNLRHPEHVCAQTLSAEKPVRFQVNFSPDGTVQCDQLGSG